MNAFDLSVCTVDSSGNPTEICTALMPPDSFGEPGTLTFTAPADLFLSANTTYAVFKPATSAFVTFGVTSSDNQDDTSDADWSIENTLESFRDSAWSAFSLSLVLRIRLNGDVAVDRATVDSVAVTSTPLLTWPAWPDSPSPDTYGPGETIEFTATFSEAVAVTGDPEFAFLLGKTVRRAAYHAAASTARRLVFRHTVLSAERDADGISVGAYPQERVAGRVETFMLDADDRIVTVSSSEDALLSHNALGTLRRHRVGAPPAVARVTSATITSTPRLTSMGSTTPDTYGLGEVIEFTVAFDRDVTVPGRPQFEFTLGDATRQARYAAAASTARVLVFRYTVAAGDSDADGIRVAGRTTAFNVDGDYFIVANGLQANLDHAELGTLSAHKVDATRTAAATVTSAAVTSTPLLTSTEGGAADTYGAGETIEFTVTFSEAVEVRGRPRYQFALADTRTDRRLADYAADAGTATALVFRYVVRPGDNTGVRGLFRLDGATAFEGIGPDGFDRIVTVSNGLDATLNYTDSGRESGHKVAGGAPVETATIATGGVRVTSTPALEDTYAAGETIEFTVTFTAPVTVTGDPEFEFSMTSARRAAFEATASTPTVLRFRYLVVETDEDTNGIWVGNQTRTLKLDDDDAIVTAFGGDPANLDHSGLGTLSGHKVDGDRVVTARIVNNGVRVTSTPTLGDTYVAGETIEFTVTFTVPVTVTGDPEFEFSLGNPGNNQARRAAYDATASTPTVLRFRYQVLATDEDSNGIWVRDQTRTFKLDPDDAITTTSSGTDANLDHSQLGTLSGHKVDGDRVVTARIVNNGVRVTSTPTLGDTYVAGETIEFTVTFTVPVTVTGDPEFEFSMTSARRAAYDATASTPTVLRFRYLVQTTDEDTNGIWVGNQTRTLKLDADDAITTTSNGTDAVLDHRSLNTQSGHKVDGDRVVTARIVNNSVRVTSSPELRSSGSPVDDTYGRGATIEFTVTFTVPVTVTGDPEFEFSMTSARRAAYDAAASTPTVLRFRYLVVQADEDTNGIWVGDQTRTLKLDADDAITTTSDGTDAVLDHRSLNTLNDHKVDGDRVAPARVAPGGVRVTSTPTLMSPGSAVADTYAAGDAIEFTVTFTTAPVTVTGDPEFEFSMGDASRRAAYVAADSTPTVLKFRYLVQVTDEDADGIWVGNQTRTLKLDADDAITTASPGSGHAILVHNPLGTLSGHKVDGTAGRMAPAAPSLTATPGDGQVTLAWTPNGDGGLPITGWYYRHAAGAAVPESVRWTGAAASPVTVPGLANDTQYAFEVAAVNTVGIGTPAVATATPTAPPACDMPSLSGRHVIWRAPLGVARLDRAPAGYGFDADVAAGRLPAAAFSVGPNRYAIAAVQVNDGGTGDGNLVVRLDGHSLTSADRARLTLHVCDTPYRFQDATPTPATHAYEWTASLDWSMTPDRELRLSLPTGNAATGKPVISGDSTKVGARVRADTTAIVDLDGLPESFDYQWMRVDEDGTSNQANIEGASGAAYVVDAADAGKRLRVVVRFSDPFGMAETATSDPWPTGGTIMANEAPTSADATVTVAEDGMHAFTAADFAFTDGDADDTLAAVRIVAVPRAGRLALDGAPVRPDTLVTRARLDAAGLTYRPTANGNGAGYASFTFRVSDGDADSGAAYTLTLDVTPVNDAPTGRPVITVIGGTPRVGRPLSATPGNVADVDGLPGAFAWQWVQVDGTIEADIATATAETYSPVAGDLGKTIKVKAVFTDGDGTRETVASAATGAVQAAVPDGGNATGRPTYVSGRPLEGSEVEFEHGAVGDPDGLNRSRIRLEWLRCDSVGENCDTVIAVGDRYTLTAADVGLRLRVRAVFVDNGGNFESRTSFPWPPRNERQVRAYGRCTDADLENLESQGRRVVWKATMTVGEGTAADLQFYGYRVFPSFGSLSSTMFRLPNVDPLTFVILEFLLIENSGARGIFDLQIILSHLHPSPIPQIGRIYARTSPETNDYLREYVQLHVCNDTFAFSEASRSNQFFDWTNDPGIFFIPGTTRIVRLSERLSDPDPDLRDLHLNRAMGGARTSRVPLSPVFLAEQTNYTATVEEAVTRVSVKAMTSHPSATLRYLDRTDADPSTPDSFEVDLDLGDNDIEIEVTGRDGGASRKKTYTTRVTRSLSDDATLRSLDLSQGTLAPAFAPAQTTYTATVGPTGLPVVTVTAQTNHPAASLEYLDSNDAALADADPATPDTFEVDLPVGDTVVKVKVTAQDDTTTQTYTTTITRQASTDASLKTLALDRGTLAPAFSPTETSYAATVGVNDNTRVTVTAEPTYPNATVEFLDAADATLADADPATPDTFEVGLAVGENVVKVKVTAEDSTTTRTYTTTIAAVVAVQVSIAAAYPTAAPGLALPAFTLTASDAAAADFEVTLTFTQDAVYLANTTQIVTIAAGDSSATQKFPISTDLSLASGNLTATITGGGIAYVPAPAPDNAATVAVVVADPLLTAVWDENAYTVREGDDDSVTVEATLRTAAGVPRPREAYAVAVATLDGSATAGADYTAVDTTLTVAPGDWTADGTQFTADLSPTVDTTDDTSLEDDETFHVLLSGATGHIAPGFDCPAALQDLGGTTGCATLVTIDDDETLSVTGVTVTSTPASGDTYLATEVIQFTAGFTAAVTVDTTGGTPTFPFRLGSAAKTATYTSGSDSDALVFTYTVAAGDLDRDGVSWQADAIELNGATVRLMTSDPSVELDADLDYQAAAAQSAHKVDARAPVLESATYLGTELTLAYDEALDDGSVPAIGQYTLTLSGGTAPSVSAVTLTLSAEPSEGTTLAYAVPTTGPVQDVVGNDAAAFSGQAVERGEQLRLVNGTGDHEGRLEIRLQGGWGTVCDDYWTKTSEDVACRILGYAQGSADAGLQASDFPPLATGNIWLDDVRCTGGETRLTECPHRRVDNSGDTRLGCTHGEDVAMRCLTSTVPYVTAVEVSAGPYAAGSTLQVTLVWSEPVNVTTPADGKPPKLWVAYGATVQSGGLDHAFEPKAELAPYASGSGTNRTVFEHTPSSRYFNDVLVSSWDRVEVLRNTLRVRDGAITSAADSNVAARLDHPGWPERLASLSVADASVNENAANAHLRFVVTLSPAVGGRITVAYATADGTATAGSDYAAVSGTLTFKAGERDKTVWVRVLSDAVDEGSETLTLTLSDPSPPAHVRLGDAEATGTINNTDPVPRAWLARFGRTLGSQVVETVSERVEGGVSGSHLSLGGVSLGGAPPDAVPLAPQDWLAGQMTDGAEAQRPEERALTGRDLLLGSSFRLVSGADDGGGTVWSAWGRVSTGGFRAAADGAALDGRVVTGLLGFDAEWRRLLAGVLLLRSEAEGGYDPLDGGDAGTIASTLTGLYPYARLRLGGRLSVWAVAGAGTGDLTLIRPHETIGTGLDVRLGALGLRGALPAVGGFDLALKSDVLWVRTASDAVAGQLAATSADVNRLRLILEGGRPWTLSSGAVLAPTVQAGLRHDGGDAETGTGVEVGAGLRYSAGMLSVDAQVRTLLAHQAGGYEEWGASGSIRLSPNASGLGPSLAVLPSWGAVDSGVARLWSQPDASALVGGGAGPAAGRVNAELGWGLAVLHGRGVLTPYARLALAEDDGRSWHLGTRLALPQSLDLSLEGSSRQAGNGTAHDLTLRATLPW